MKSPSSHGPARIHASRRRNRSRRRWRRIARCASSKRRAHSTAAMCCVSGRPFTSAIEPQQPIGRGTNAEVSRTLRLYRQRRRGDGLLASQIGHDASERGHAADQSRVGRSIDLRGHANHRSGRERTSAANAVWIDDAVIYPSSFPKTRRRLEEAGLHLKIIEATEVAKAESAVTCCSLIFRERS